MFNHLSNFEFIHNQFLKNCISHSYLHKQISINGVIELKKPPIKFFSFFCKTIISQQISDKAANKIWDKFCNCLNKKKLDLLSFQRNELYSKLLIDKYNNNKNEIKT